MDEPQSCDYIITVATAKICPITQLRPEEIAKPKEINCAPLFSQQEYDKWLDIKESKNFISCSVIQILSSYHYTFFENFIKKCTFFSKISKAV